MKQEFWVFFPVSLFLFVAAGAYAILTKLEEPIGVVALAMGGLLCVMIAAYMRLLASKMDARPSDRKEAEIAEGAGEMGFFPAKSIWPLWLALTVSVMALGPVFGWWITLLGMGMGIWSLTGWVYEFYRGPYKH